MAAMLSQSPVVLRTQQQQKEDQDIPNYVHGKMRQAQEVWSYPQEWQPQPYINNPCYYSYQHYPPHMYQQQQSRSHRPRTQSTPSNTNIQPQKSSSTPTSQQQQQHLYQQRQRKNRSNDPRRPKSMMMMQTPPSSRPIPITPVSSSDSGRRSSITSTSSTVSQSVSIRSEMSLGTKLSLSKRLRKVFSVGNLRSSSSSKSLGSLGGASSSNVSVATVDMIPEETSDSPITPSTPPQRSLRRRSLASLSTLFQKSSPSPSSPQPSTRRPSTTTTTTTTTSNSSSDKKDRPSLRVDTTQPSMTSSSSTPTSSAARKPAFKGRSPVIAPDSPNSSVSTRSPVTRAPTPGPHRLASGLPSPTPSATSSSSSSSSSQQKQRVPSLTHDDDDDHPSDLAMAPPPVIGLHYGLPMHGSPKLKPASSSSSSLIDQVTPLPSSKRRLQFCPTVQVHETFASSVYDRRCDVNSTCQKLTMVMALQIKQELNEYKLTEMDVHVDSRKYTQFFL